MNSDMHDLCDECGHRTVYKILGPSSYSFKTTSIGMVKIPEPLAAYVCEKDNCRSISWPATSLETISKHVKESIDKAIGRLPIDDFVEMDLAAEILGKSKQSLSKNLSFKKKIYSKKKGNSIFYYRPSIVAYKEIGDGRVFIGEKESTTQTTPMFSSDIEKMNTAEPIEIYRRKIEKLHQPQSISAFTALISAIAETKTNTAKLIESQQSVRIGFYQPKPISAFEMITLGTQIKEFAKISNATVGYVNPGQLNIQDWTEKPEVEERENYFSAAEPYYQHPQNLH